MIQIFVLIMGILLSALGTAEIIKPVKAFDLWSRWILSRYFRLHGMILIIGGVPLVIYTGPISGALFLLGVISLMTAPYILIYPEKIRAMFIKLTNEMRRRDITRFIYTEGILRILIGTLFIITFFM